MCGLMGGISRCSAARDQQMGDNMRRGSPQEPGDLGYGTRIGLFPGDLLQGGISKVLICSLSCSKR